MKFCCFENYTSDDHEKAVVEMNLPDYKNVDNVYDAYSNYFKN